MNDDLLDSGPANGGVRHYGIPPWRSPESSFGQRPAAGEVRCRTAIVGGGLAGVAAALHLMETGPDDDVVVLEADRIAAGASGRGTGLVGPRIGQSLTDTRRKHGDVVTRALYEWSVAAVDHVIALSRAHQFDCGMTVGSQLVVAVDERSRRGLGRELAVARDLGLPIEEVPATELPPTQTDYLGGMRLRPAATVDPAALTAAVACAAHRAGVLIVEGARVRNVTPGRPVRLETSSGEVIADRVVIAVNACEPGTNVATGIVRLRAQAAATAVLSPGQLAELDWLTDQPLIEAGDLAPYFRLTPEGRIIVGGGGLRRGAIGSEPLAVETLRAAVNLLAPSLADVPFEFAWSGPIGVTSDGLPVLGRRYHNILLAGGWRGHGVAAAAFAGSLIADQLQHRAGDGAQPELFPVERGLVRRPPMFGPIPRLIDGYLSHLERRVSRSLTKRQPAAPSGAVAGKSTKFHGERRS
ncbi:NAD(P)/FAD-dependent oxidoreductase [Nocardia fluminea]|uniref:NAD(P)/FAD-dependent oxidoreductase n=1 Tax=Nocardia fluminea TaxID=134984 RepID=UPI0036720B1A